MEYPFLRLYIAHCLFELGLVFNRTILNLQSRDKTRSELRLQWHPWVQRFLANEVSVDSTEALYFLLSPLVSPCFTHDAMAFPAFPVLVLVKSAVFFVGSKLARHSYRSPVSGRWGSPFFQTPRYLRLLIKPYQTNQLPIPLIPTDTYRNYPWFMFIGFYKYCCQIMVQSSYRCRFTFLAYARCLAQFHPMV